LVVLELLGLSLLSIFLHSLAPEHQLQYPALRLK
jgi:hypothetical protein